MDVKLQLDLIVFVPYAFAYPCGMCAIECLFMGKVSVACGLVAYSQLRNLSRCWASKVLPLRLRLATSLKRVADCLALSCIASLDRCMLCLLINGAFFPRSELVVCYVDMLYFIL